MAEGLPHKVGRGPDLQVGAPRRADWQRKGADVKLIDVLFDARRPGLPGTELIFYRFFRQTPPTIF